ncbi:MAG: hypothetical protein JSW45_03555 [Thiotrichales bacterium]|nr:MAG: hypothetical protein JSW45_03555 [Thiotrichales bacterium]
MKNSTKGVLLSALVFPGLGQLVLKRYLPGFSIMLVVVAALILLIREALRQAHAILARLEAEGGPVDMAAITDAAHRAAGESGSTVSTVALLMLVAGWCIGVFDAWSAGRKIDSRTKGQ